MHTIHPPNLSQLSIVFLPSRNIQYFISIFPAVPCFDCGLSPAILCCWCVGVRFEEFGDDLWRSVIYCLMDQLYNFFVGSTVSNYVEAGFSEREAEAMSWIAEQKPKGKFYGFLTGSFLALTWGHWHNRIMAHLGIKCKRYYTQLALIGIFITAGDYLTCQPRYGANEYFANNLLLNNNLFLGNLNSLNQNFEVLNRKFTKEQVEIFNQRARALRSNIPLAQRKWIFNPQIESQEEFERRRRLNLSAPWEDAEIRKVIHEENKDKQQIVYGPKELGKLIDETGQKLGIVKDYTFGWRPI